MKGNLLVLVGLPASGKTTWAKTMKKDISTQTINIISSDEIREEILGDVNNQDFNNKVFETMFQRTRKSLGEYDITIFDATNLSMKKRKNLLEYTKKYCNKKICMVFPLEKSSCIARDFLRDRSVGKEVINRMYKNFQSPSYFEGWDRISVSTYNVAEESYGFEPQNLKYHFDNLDLKYCDYIKMLRGLGLHSCIEMPQDSKYHSLSLSKHMYKCYTHVFNHGKDVEDRNLIIASLLHDIGKPQCKTAEEDGIYCHYYNHENTSSYEALRVLSNYSNLETDDIIDIATLIQYHMRLMDKNFEQGRDKFVRRVGYGLYSRLVHLNNGDCFGK